ncbi:MAG: diguanylate cyclase [Elusimicrobia bacterium]|nr:diguanylate cyclase [Elusimicrobiota bacterium]
MNQKNTILIIDDNEDLVKMMSLILEQEGYNVLQANSGQKGLEIVKKQAPDCILLDRKMPLMDGLEVCKHLKSNEKTKHIPVILVTAVDAKQDIIDGINAGADDFVAKYQDSDILLTRIKAMLRIKELHDKLEGELDYSKKMIYFSKEINTTDMNQIFEILKENIEGIFGLQKFSLFFYDNKSDTLKLGIHNQENLKNKEIIIQRNTKSMMWDVVDKKELFIVNDFENSPYFKGVKLHRDDFAVSIPLIIDKGVIGVINMNDSHEGKPPEELVRKATIAVEHLASSIATSNAYKKIQKLSITDELTGLYNRRYWNMRLNKEFVRAKRYNHNLCCIMIDIDHFKSINDRYGHQCGDFILKEMAAVLSENIRKSDVICRYGGEEFCVLAVETEIKGALELAEKLRKAIKEHQFNYSVIFLRLTISLGVCVYPNDGVSVVEDIVRIADEMLYKAKEAGRDRIVNFSS